MRPVLKPVTQTSDMEGKDTAMWWTVRRAGDVGHRHTIHVLCNVVTTYPRPVSTLISHTVPNVNIQ